MIEEPDDYAVKIPGIHEQVSHPVHKHYLSIYEIIVDLNDSHGWTREEIADWLDTLDNQPVFKEKIKVHNGESKKLPVTNAVSVEQLKEKLDAIKSSMTKFDETAQVANEELNKLLESLKEDNA